MLVCRVHSETARVDVGLAVELWNKGMLWDKLMGTHWLPLTTVKQSNKVITYIRVLYVVDFSAVCSRRAEVATDCDLGLPLGALQRLGGHDP